jgi:hypothetical protein
MPLLAMSRFVSPAPGDAMAFSTVQGGVPGMHWEVGSLLAKAFEIHVRGALTREQLEEFENLTAVAVPAETILSGVIPDQSALYGVLNRLQSLGFELVEVRPLKEDAP